MRLVVPRAPRVRTLFAAALAGGLFLVALPAACGEAPAPAEGAPPPAPPPSSQTRPEATREREPLYGSISGRVDALSRRIDAFFGGERAYEESTSTTLKLLGGVQWREDGDFHFLSRVRLKLDLPYLRERLQRFHILLESDVDEDLEEEGNIQVANALETQTNASSYNAAVQFAPRVPVGWKVTTDAGVKFVWPPDPFARLRIRRSFDLGREWLLRATQRVFWFTSDGLGETTTVEFERALGSESLFNLASEVRWEDKEEGLSLLHRAAVFQGLGPNTALVYSAGFRQGTSPAFRTTQYETSVRFRSRLLSPWLFYEIEPAAVWPRSDAFRPAGSIFFRLEALFGADYRC